MDAADLIPLAIIAVIVVIWVVMRRKAPGLIGLDEDRSRQRLDHVRLEPCRACGRGFMEQYFRRWRYFFSFGFTPAFIYLIGRPDEYRCTSCGSISGEERNGRRITRISLSQNVPAAFILSFISLMLLGGAIILIIDT
jgi:hypothetical protein